MSYSHLATAYARILFRHLRLEEQGSERFFAHTDLTYRQLMSMSHPISFEDQRQLFLNALELYGKPGLGLSVGAALQPATHGPIGVAALSSPDLGTALEVLVRYSDTRAQFLAIELRRTREGATVRLRERVPLGALELFLTESVVCSLHAAIGFFAGPGPWNGRIDFAYGAPDYAGQYARAFQLPVRFGAAATQIQLDHELLGLPSPVADPALHRSALRQCEQHRENLAETTATMSEAVVRLLADNPGRIWSLDEVAGQLHLSSRSLIRKLAQEDTRFQTLRDQQLATSAQRYLLESSLTVAAIAELVGFSDAASFRRSFRRWTGTTPVAFRNRRTRGGLAD